VICARHCCSSSPHTLNIVELDIFDVITFVCAHLHLPGFFHFCLTRLFIPPPPDNVVEGMFSGVRPPRSFIRPFVRTDLVTTNGSSNLDENYREYSLAFTDEILDLGGQRSRSQQAVEVAQASTSTLQRRSHLVLELHRVGHCHAKEILWR